MGILGNNYRKFVEKYRHEILLFFITIFACAIVFAIPRILEISNTQYLETPAYTLAKNLVQHGVYTDNDSNAPPLYPHSTYTPLYSLLIIPFVWSTTAILILNWILRGFLVVLLYRIILLLEVRKKIAFIAAAVFSIEPYQLILANSVQAETLFTTILILFVFSLFRYLQNPETKTIIIASILLGLSTLTRPIAEFLVILFPLIISLNALPIRKKIVHIILSIFVFVLVLSPWLLRNHSIYGYWALSSLPAHQMLNANIPFFLEWKYGDKNFSESSVISRMADIRREASIILGKDITKRGTVDIAEAKIIMKEIAIPFIYENWPNLIVFYGSQLPFQMMTDNWRTALHHISGWPQHSVTPLSAAHAAVRGDFSQILETVKNFDSYLGIFILGKLYWMSAYILAIIGFFVLIRKKQFKIIALIFALLIVYFPFLSLPYLESRYRFPSTPYVFILAAIGATWCLDIYRSKQKKIPQKTS